MTAGLKAQIERLSRIAPRGLARKRRVAIGSWAAMVGAMILARMSDDAKLSDEVLSETRAWLAAQDQGKSEARTTGKSARRIP